MKSRIFKRGLIPTLQDSSRQNLLESHNMLLRGGYVSPSTTGVFSVLPAGQRVLDRITRIVVDELEAIGANRVTLPSLIDSAEWKLSGRWSDTNHELMKVIDRRKHAYVLAPTSEEAVVHLAKQTIHTYSQLPVTLYQVSTKWRDEQRPRGGLLRSREFLMKDAYSFHVDQECATNVYNSMRDVYERIFARLELPVMKAHGDSGDIGGSFSEEFHFLSESGEDTIIRCRECGHAWNSELEGHSCGCGAAPVVDKFKTIEVAHLFQLGDKYSKPMQLLLQGKQSDERITPLMNCYGVGVSRILQTLVECKANASNDSIAWPTEIAPYDRLIVCDTDLDGDVVTKCAKGDTLVDDRSRLSIGRKLKDAQLLGIPHTYVFGRKWKQSGQVEIHDNQGNVHYESL